MTARRKVEVSLRTVTSGDAVPLTTHHARFGKSAALGLKWWSRPPSSWQPADLGVSTSGTPEPSQPPFLALQHCVWTPRTPRSRFRPPERSSMQSPHAQPSGASISLSAGTSAPACTLASACVAAPCHQAPCRPPLADVRGRARCFLESTAPHQQSTTLRNRQGPLNRAVHKNIHT